MLQDIENPPAPLPPSPSPSPPAAPSRTPKGIDRAAAARLLAEGRSVAEAARELGCSRQNLWRQVRRSKRLARLIRSAEEEARTDAFGKLSLLGPAAVDTLRRALVKDDDAGVAFKIADRMKLFERPVAADPIRGEIPARWDTLASVLAAVMQRAIQVSRRGRVEFRPADYMFLWEEAVAQQEARGLPSWSPRRARTAPPSPRRDEHVYYREDEIDDDCDDDDTAAPGLTIEENQRDAD